jgi:hypothetical protein
VYCQSFAEGWISRPRNTSEPRNKVNFAIAGNIKRKPSKLSRREVDALVRGKEVRFGVFVVWEVGLKQG